MQLRSPTVQGSESLLESKSRFCWISASPLSADCDFVCRFPPRRHSSQPGVWAARSVTSPLASGSPACLTRSFQQDLLLHARHHYRPLELVTIPSSESVTPNQELSESGDS